MPDPGGCFQSRHPLPGQVVHRYSSPSQPMMAIDFVLQYSQKLDAMQ